MKRFLVVIFLTTLFISSSIFSQDGETKYYPNWESLDKRKTPEWFADAKFGIFIHFGLYSVPAWAPKGKYAEWYWHRLAVSEENEYWEMANSYHTENYGSAFKYEDFSEGFFCELFDPDEWVNTFQRSGAKYVVLTSKHHDGFTLWPSKEASESWNRKWNSFETGPKRDLVRELSDALKEINIKFGCYFSLYEWFNPIWLNDTIGYIEKHMLPQIRDLMVKYNPDLLWADGEWALNSKVWKTEELLAWMYNELPNKDELVVNDRWGSDCRHQHGGYYTTEYGSGLNSGSKPWEECRGMGTSFGYNRIENAEDYKSSRELLLMLIDIVSRGGNLLLNIGPRADGKIPPIMEQRLLDIGKWLDVNGEAIYGTKAYIKSCQWSEGIRNDIERVAYKGKFDILEETIKPPKGYGVKQLFFTQKENNLYVISPIWPAKEIIIKDFTMDNVSEIIYLETKESLKWEALGDDLVIQLPDYNPEKIRSKLAYAYKIVLKE